MILADVWHLASTAGGAIAPPQWNIWNLAQLGLIGIGFACLALGKWIVPAWTLANAEVRHAKELAAANARADKAESQVERLQGVFQDQMIPALTRSTEAQARVTDELSRWRWSKPPEAGGTS